MSRPPAPLEFGRLPVAVVGAVLVVAGVAGIAVVTALAVPCAEGDSSCTDARLGMAPLLMLGLGIWLAATGLAVVFLLAALLPGARPGQRWSSIAATATLVVLNPYVDYLLLSATGRGGVVFSIGVVLAGVFLLLGTLPVRRRTAAGLHAPEAPEAPEALTTTVASPREAGGAR